MRIIAKSTIKKFQMQPGYRDAEGLLEGCYFAGTHTQYDRIDVELNVGWVQNTRLPSRMLPPSLNCEQCAAISALQANFFSPPDRRKNRSHHNPMNLVYDFF